MSAPTVPRPPTPPARTAPRPGINRNDPFGGDEFSLELVTNTAKPMPDRVIAYTPEGWGKTSFAAQSPDPLFLMTRGEDGLLTLKRTGQLPADLRHFPRCAETWEEFMRGLAAVAAEHVCETLVIDTGNGAQTLLTEKVCHESFGDDWPKFNMYLNGLAACQNEWGRMLTLLDKVRAAGSGIFLLCHTAVANVKNPQGIDYQRMQPAIDHKYLWPLTQRWGDLILYGQFEQWVEPETKPDPKQKVKTMGKATGGSHRIILCQPAAAFAAKNRHGLPEEIDCGESAAEAWANFQAALKGDS